MEAPGSYVVAYEPTDRGDDAVGLAIALARLTRAELKFCLVLPEPGSVPEGLRVSLGDYAEMLERQAEDTLERVAARVPAEIPRTVHVRWGDSPSEALIRAAESFGSERIVVGAARQGLLGRLQIGSVANALLHASPVAVALAPRGYRAPERIGRITCAVGTRAGWRELLDSTVAITDDIAPEVGVDVRFVTLVALGRGGSLPEPVESGRTQVDAHLDSVVEYYRERSSRDDPISTESAAGDDVEDAVELIDWRPDEVALVGSSRLAQTARLFLGVTAHRMLHALPVPLIVVPLPARR